MNNEQIPNPLLKRVFLTPNRPAVKFQDKEYTFQEIYDLAFQIAGRLERQGARKGQFFAVLLKNHVDTIVIFLALQLLGIKAVILNNRLTLGEILWQLRDSQPFLFITEESFAEKLHPLREEPDTIPIITKEGLKHAPFIKPHLLEEVFLEDVCSVMYTSGTTGKPKGVMQTFGNHWWSAVGSALNLGLHDDDCWLCAVPLFHISGYSILMRALFYGMKIVLHESFDEKLTLYDMKKEKVTIMSVVTATALRILDALKEERLPDTFRCMLLGGGPAPLSVIERCVEKGIPVYQTYGMTETASQIATLSTESSIQKIGSAGKPLFPAQIKIVNGDGENLEPLQSGEIVVKGPNVTIGYLNQETNSFKKDGWFHTGDIGYLDDEGFLYVQDRRSDLIISGGENIYPAEIEGILLSHPSVNDAGVVGKNDGTWGQIPVAFVEKEGELTEEELVLFCAERLAKYKVPKEIYYVEKIPRNASKKLLRKNLRRWLEKDPRNEL